MVKLSIFCLKSLVSSIILELILLLFVVSSWHFLLIVFSEAFPRYCRLDYL